MRNKLVETTQSAVFCCKTQVDRDAQHDGNMQGWAPGVGLGGGSWVPGAGQARETVVETAGRGSGHVLVTQAPRQMEQPPSQTLLVIGSWRRENSGWWEGVLKIKCSILERTLVTAVDNSWSSQNRQLRLARAVLLRACCEFRNFHTDQEKSVATRWQ